MSIETEDDKKKKLAELDLQQQIKLAKSDSTYRQKHPELEMYLTGDLNDKEVRDTVEKLVDAKNKKEAQKEESIDDLKTELDAAKSALALIAEKKLNEKMDSLGIRDANQRQQFMNDPDSLKAFEAGMKAAGGGKKEAPAGSAPLQSDYFAQLNQNQTADLRHRKFQSYEEMVKFLHAEIANGSKEAQTALDELMRKSLSDYGKLHGDISYNPNDSAQKTSGVPEIVMDNLKEKEPSELKKFGIKKKKGRWGQKPTPEEETEG